MNAEIDKTELEVAADKERAVVAKEPSIMGLLADAVKDPEFDANKLEQLIMLKERVDATEAKKAFIDAMAEFNADPPKLVKNSAGNNSKFARLDNSIQLIRPALLRVGITPSWETEQLENGHVMVTCILSHRLGHERKSSLSGAAEDSGSKNATQGIGSTVSYFRRYTLEAVCGLVAEGEDTDGNVPDKIIDADKLSILRKKADETEGDVPGLCKYFKISSLAELTESNYYRAIGMLDEKVRRK